MFTIEIEDGREAPIKPSDFIFLLRLYPHFWLTQKHINLKLANFLFHTKVPTLECFQCHCRRSIQDNLNIEQYSKNIIKYVKFGLEGYLSKFKYFRSG